MEENEEADGEATQEALENMSLSGKPLSVSAGAAVYLRLLGTDLVQAAGEDAIYLAGVLPASLAASLAGVKEPGPASPEALERLRFAARIARRVEASESRVVASAWLTSANEALGLDLPVRAIREGRFAEVEDAVERFLEGWVEGWGSGYAACWWSLGLSLVCAPQRQGASSATMRRSSGQ